MSYRHSQVESQFTPVAANYATSVGHSSAAALDNLVMLAQPRPEERMLDIATGAGNVALAFAPLVATVAALDLTSAMLDQVLRSAKERGISNIVPVLGKAESLPFPDASFSLVVNRLAAHHFADLPAALTETFRVLTPGGQFILVDSTGSDDIEASDKWNELEKLRDPSHGKNLRPDEWRAALIKAGFQIESADISDYTDGDSVEVQAWMERIGTPAEFRPKLIEEFRNPSEGLKALLSIEQRDSTTHFRIPQITILATKSL